MPIKKQPISFEFLSAEDAFALLDQPELWDSLSDRDLDLFVHFAISLYGTTGRLELIPKLMPLYEQYVERIEPSARLNQYEAMRDQVMAGELPCHGLLPYLIMDDELSVVSTATLDYSLLKPLEHGDPLSGPRSVLNLIRQGTVTYPAAALGGLVALGDQRVMELLGPMRQELDDADVEAINLCWTGHLYAARIEFYLSWLEALVSDNDEQSFGAVAAHLFNLPQCDPDAMVHSIERVFPSTADNAITTLESWPLSEYAKRISPRLRAIADKENEPKIMSHVLEAWGLC